MANPFKSGQNLKQYKLNKRKNRPQYSERTSYSKKETTQSLNIHINIIKNNLIKKNN